jgi:hypothetical protein
MKKAANRGDLLVLGLMLLLGPPRLPCVAFASAAEKDAMPGVATEWRKLSGKFGGSRAVFARRV